MQALVGLFLVSLWYGGWIGAIVAVIFLPAGGFTYQFGDRAKGLKWLRAGGIGFGVALVSFVILRAAGPP